MRLSVPVEKFENVIVLPTEAVVRDGVEAYVFRHNGEVFDRKPVQVLSEDRRILISPTWASAAMSLSSLSVVGNALRLRLVSL